MIYDDRRCELGEGPLWHPLRKQLFWFDILGKRLLTREGDTKREWAFDDYVSAAGWIDEDTLLIASSRALHRFDIETGAMADIIALEADNPVTRSNDGRADPWGGFWIGTMGIKLEKDAGAIYRHYNGELRQLYAPITVPNAICFHPTKAVAYFTDTPTRIIQQQVLDPETGWPMGAPMPFLDLTKEALNPDGAVMDAEGTLWNAQWGANRVATYDPKGRFLKAYPFDGTQISCPAFGGEDLSTLFVTSAAEGLTGDAEGLTYAQENAGKGQKEHRVLL